MNRWVDFFDSLKRMQYKSLKFNTALNTFRMALTVLMPLITFPYISRIFLTEGTGKISFSASVVQVFTLFASLGLYSYGIREGSKVRENREKFSLLAHELWFINLVSTGISYLVFFVFVFLVPSFAKYRVLLLINGLTIGFTALGLDWVYGVYEEYIYITVRQIVTQIFTIIVMFVFIRSINDIYLWVFLTVISGVGANFFNFLHARKYIDFGINKISLNDLSKHIVPILLLLSTQLAARIYANIDTILVGLITTDHHVGLYGASIKLNSILITCFTAMSPVFMPRIIVLIKECKHIEYYTFLKRIFRLILFLGLPAVVGIEMLANEIILLLSGNAFFEAGYTIRILAPIILITACANIIHYDFLVPNNMERRVLMCTIITAFINLAISLLLIPIYRQNGAALGSLIAEFLGLIISIKFCFDYDKNIIYCIPSMRNYVLGCLGIVFTCLSVKSFISNYVLVLAISIPASVLCYGVILILLKDDMYYECRTIIFKMKY